MKASKTTHPSVRATPPISDVRAQGSTLGPVAEAASTIETLLESLRSGISRAERTFEPVLRESTELPLIEASLSLSPIHGSLLGYQKQLREAIARLDALADRSTL